MTKIPKIFLHKPFTCVQLKDFGTCEIKSISITNPIECYQVFSKTYDGFVANVSNVETGFFELEFWGERESMKIFYSDLFF